MKDYAFGTMETAQNTFALPTDQVINTYTAIRCSTLPMFIQMLSKLESKYQNIDQCFKTKLVHQLSFIASDKMWVKRR